MHGVLPSARLTIACPSIDFKILPGACPSRQVASPTASSRLLER